MGKFYHSEEIYCMHCGKPLGSICLFKDENEKIFQTATCLNCLPDILRKWDLSNKNILDHSEHYKFDFTQQNSVADCNHLIKWIEEANPTVKIRIGLRKGDKI